MTTMKIEKDIRMLSIMHFRMSSLLAFLSHSMRLLSYLAKPVNGVKEERMVFNGMKCSPEFWHNNYAANAHSRLIPCIF